jgi:diamine N-acetyltransferase
MSGRYKLKNKGIRLEKVNDNNFVDLMKLEVAESQKDYVASNTVSMAQAYAVNASGRFVQCFGIYDGDTAVGFAMIGHHSEEYNGMAEIYRHSYYLWRFMIDHRFQGKGFGRDALNLLLDYVLSFPDGEEDTWSTSYDQENEAARHLYASFGFAPNGEKDSDYEDAEEVAVLPLK